MLTNRLYGSLVILQLLLFLYYCMYCIIVFTVLAILLPNECVHYLVLVIVL